MPKKSMSSKRKRLSKQARLNSALDWIKKYDGKNIIAGYAKWFGVDKICAINELKSIGVVFPEDLVNQVIASHKLRLKQKSIIREKNKITDIMPVESDDNFAFIVGYTSGGFPYGLEHDDLKEIESEKGQVSDILKNREGRHLCSTTG
jgi:hypothetical protein